MTKRSGVRGGRGSRRGDEAGAALLEFAIVATLLFTLVFGIIVFGILLQRKQQGVQAAAEGARAAVPVGFTAIPGRSDYLFNPLLPEPAPVTAARNAVDDAMEDSGRRCARGDSETTEVGGVDGLRCSIALVSCTNAAVPYTAVSLAADYADNQRTDDLCIRVRLVDVNAGDTAFTPPLPFVQAAIPNQLRSTSVAELGGLIQ